MSNDNTPTPQRNPNRIGGLWKNKSLQNGKTYLSGEFEYKGEKVKINVYPNETKQNEKSPDFSIYLKGDKSVPAPTHTAPAPRPTRAPRTAPPKPPEDDVPDSAYLDS